MPQPDLASTSTPISDVADQPDASTATVSGHVTRIRLHHTHDERPWAQITLTDPTGGIDVYVFPQHYAHAGALITPDAHLAVTGRLNRASDHASQRDVHLYGYDLRHLDHPAPAVAPGGVHTSG